MSSLSLTRRGVLLAAAAGLASGRVLARQGGVAVIDWGLLETCLALGLVPSAATELRQFRQIAVEPEVPHSVADLGLRGSPNIELLHMMAPQRILISGFYEYQRPVLERVAPVMALPIHEAGKPPYDLALFSTLALGERFGRQDEAQRFVDAAAAALQRLRQRAAPLARYPVFAISLGDSRHFRAFGGDSMFGDVLARLGLANAWTDPTSYSAAAPVGLEALARVADASIVVVGPLPPEVRRTLGDNALWNALPAVRDGRVAMIDPVNHFGGLPSALRFARLMTQGFGV